MGHHIMKCKVITAAVILIFTGLVLSYAALAGSNGTALTEWATNGHSTQLMEFILSMCSFAVGGVTSFTACCCSSNTSPSKDEESTGKTVSIPRGTWSFVGPKTGETRYYLLGRNEWSEAPMRAPGSLIQPGRRRLTQRLHRATLKLS